jgi:competence protein ComEC
VGWAIARTCAQGDEKMKSIVTRFRAYQLGCPGSSFSYFADGRFTLIEARLNDTNKASVIQDMAICGVETASCLHITSWDSDHCSASDLPAVLQTVLPTRIECPGYEPSSDSGKECRQIIQHYEARRRNSNRSVEVEFITPAYIDALQHAERLAFRNVFYNPRWLDLDCTNNNSTVKFFREGSFNLLSLGDVESHEISARLRRCLYLRREVDVMILAHHGADNGFTNKRFLQHIEPTLAICSSNYDNQYEHPTEDIRELLWRMFSEPAAKCREPELQPISHRERCGPRER